MKINFGEMNNILRRRKKMSKNTEIQFSLLSIQEKFSISLDQDTNLDSRKYNP